MSCYVVLDLEWNQPRSAEEMIREPFAFDSEIIEIGAVKLNDSFETIDEYKVFIAPFFYSVLNGDVSRLTHISKGTLKEALPFPEAYSAFIDWCGEDYSFMTWGPTDLPVLMDNLLMHKMSLDSIPTCYDLQRIFGNEILRENRQCSLESAVKMLNLPLERSHDALHDSKNTVKIAGFMDLEDYIDEYPMRYVNYAEDRIALSDMMFPSLSEAIKRPELAHFSCPYCGSELTCSGWRTARGNKVIGYAKCDACFEGDENEYEYFVRAISHRRSRNTSVTMTRLIFEMSDDLWDIYNASDDDSANTSNS